MLLLRAYLRGRHFEIFTISSKYKKDHREFAAVRVAQSTRRDGESKCDIELTANSNDVLMCRFYYSIGITLTPLEKCTGFPLRPTERAEVLNRFPCKLYFRDKPEEALNRHPFSTGNHTWRDLMPEREWQEFI